MIVRGADVSHTPRALSFPGGKVEPNDGPDEAFESTLRREIPEEVAVEIGDEVVDVDSRRFDTDDGRQALNVTFLCRFRSGTPTANTDEVKSVRWMTVEEILREARPWFKPAKMQRIEEARLREDLKAV